MQLFNDVDLFEVFNAGDADDVIVLIDHITDTGKGRISLSDSVCQKLVAAKVERRINAEILAIVVEELQRFGGNSLMNIFRGGAGVSYQEIVKDVADHVKAPYSAGSNCAQMETAIMFEILEQSMDKMSDEQREQIFQQFGANYTVGAGPASMAALLAVTRMTGAGAFRISAVVADAAARALLGRGLALGASAGITRSLSLLAGPIGWFITGIWTAFDLASPAYRVTVPCVIQIAYMRQKSMTDCCPNCQALINAGDKFCSACGSPLFKPTRLIESH